MTAGGLNFGIRLTADGAAFNGPVRLANEEISRLDQNTRKASGGSDALAKSLGTLKNQALALVSIGTAIGAVFKFAKNADEVALLDARLKIATRTSEDFAKAQAGLVQIASRLQLGYGEVVGSFNRINVALRQVGGNTDLALRVTELFASTLKISGASATEASSAMLQFGQAISSGRLQGDELRSLLENNSRFAQALAESLGVNVGQLRKLGEEGKLTVDKIVAGLTSQASKIQSEVGQIPRTIGGAFTELGNQFSRLGAEMDRTSGFSKAFATVGAEVARTIKDIADEQKALASDGSIDQITKLFRSAALVILEFVDAIRLAVTGWELLIGTIKDLTPGVLRQTLADMREAFAIMGRFIGLGQTPGERLENAGGTSYAESLRRRLERERVADSVVAQYSGQDLGDQVSRRAAQGNTPRLSGGGDDERDKAERQKRLDAALALAQKERELAKANADAIYSILKASGDAELALLKANSETSLANLTAFYAKKKELLLRDVEEKKEALLDEIAAQENVVRAARKTGDRKDELAAMAKLVELRAKLAENQLRVNETIEIEADLLKARESMADKYLGSARAELQNAQERADAYGKSKAAILDEAIAKEKAKLASISFGDVNDEEIALYREKIKLLEQARDLQRNTDAREASDNFFKKQAADAKKASDQINEALTDALFRSFESGESFGKAFLKNLENAAKSTILKPTIEFIMAPLKNAVSNFFGNVLGGGGPGGGGFNPLNFLGGGGPGGGFGSMFGNFLGLGTSGTSGGFGSLLSGGVPVNGGSFYNVPGVSSPIGTSGGGFMSSAAPFALAALAGAGIGRLVGRNNNNRSTAGGAAGATIGMAVGGPIGAAIGAVLGGLAADRGGAKTGGSSFQSFSSTGRILGDARVPGSDNGRYYTPRGEDGTARDLTKTISEGFFANLAALGGKVGGNVQFGIGFDKDPKGSAQNRISSGVFVNGQKVFGSQDRGVGRDDANLVKELGLEAQRAMLAGLQASELPKAISDVLKSVDVASASEEQIKKALEISLTFKRIIDQAGAGLKNFTDKLSQFKDAAPETISALGTIFEYLGLDPFAQIAEDSMTLADAWRSQGEEIRKLVSDFDGSEAAIQRLGELTAARYQTEIQLAAAVNEALQSIADTTANSIRNIRLSILDDEGKYGFLDKEAASLFDQLKLADDPAVINNLVQQLNAIINQAFGLLSPEEQKARAEEFIARLNDVSGVASDRLKDIKDQITGDKAEDLPTSIRNAIEAAMNKAADKLAAAGDTNLQAANTLNAGANTFAGAVNNITTGGGVSGNDGFGSNQVTVFDRP